MNNDVVPSNQYARTILHLAPAVIVAAVVAAHSRQMRLNQWLETLILEHQAGDENDPASSASLSRSMLVELFARVASRCPEILQGRWRLLRERCLLEPSLWHHPKCSDADIENGCSCTPYLDIKQLETRWPALVASCWLIP